MAAPMDSPWQLGDRLVLPDLAKTLTTIADQGPDAFYSGEIARALVAEMQRGDGLISMSDLEQLSGQDSRCHSWSSIAGIRFSAHRHRHPAGFASSSR